MAKRAWQNNPKIPVLDENGYLQLIRTWGDEEEIIEAARMSTDKGFLGWGPGPSCTKCKKIVVERWNTLTGTTSYFCPTCKTAVNEPLGPVVSGDEGLLKYLHTKHHDTPFEMPGATFEVQAPIAVFREWMRHRVPFGYNELSARYVPIPDEHYIPTVDRLLLNQKVAASTHQAGVIESAEVLTEAAAEEWRQALAALNKESQRVYMKGLAAGVPKELARGAVTVFRYSRMRVTGNLRGWLNFLWLRSSPDAMWEIRQYSKAIESVLEKSFPRVLELFHASQKRHGTMEAALDAAKTRIRELEAALAAKEMTP